MTTFEQPFQKAIYGALADNVTVNAAIVPVYDYVGPGNVDTFPRIVLGNFEIEPVDDKSTSDQDLFLTIDIWSRQRGKKETQLVMSAIHSLLHRQALSLDSGTAIVVTAATPTRILQDPDGLTYHGVQTWRGQIQGQ